MRTILCYIVAVFSSSVYAQNLSNEIAKINAYYTTESALEVNYSYQLFMNKNSSKPEEQKFVVMYKKGKKQYMKFDQYESVTTPEYNLYVDHSAKEMILTKGPTPFGKQQAPVSNITETISSLITECADTSFSQKAGVGNIQLKCEASQFDKITIQYSLKNHALKKLTLQMRKNELMEKGIQPQIVIAYSKIKKGGTLPPQVFSYEQFITTNSSGDLVMKESMKGYTFSNYL